MAERIDALNRIVSEAQWWSDFSQSDAWEKVKERIEKEIISPAKDAFWMTDSDSFTNEQIARNTLSQKNTVRTSQRIIAMVEGDRARLQKAQRELNTIADKSKQKGDVKNG